MLLSAIFHILKKVFSLAIKVIAWLLVSLSLWVPLVYTLLFVIGCGFSGASLTELKTWFIAGLALSFIASFAVSTYLYERNIKRKKQQKMQANVEKVKEKAEKAELKKKKNYVDPALKAEETPVEMTKSDIVSQAKSAYYQSAEADEPKDKTEMTGGEYKQDLAAKHGFYSYDALKDLSEGGIKKDDDFAENPYENNNKEEYTKYNRPQSPGNQFSQTAENQYNQYGQGNQYNQYNQTQYEKYESRQQDGRSTFDNVFDEGGLQIRDSGGYANADGYDEYKNIFDSPVLSRHDFVEKPKVFAMRNDPTVFVYEYADRLEYYKRTRSGMVLMETKNK